MKMPNMFTEVGAKKIIGGVALSIGAAMTPNIADAQTQNTTNIQQVGPEKGIQKTNEDYINSKLQKLGLSSIEIKGLTKTGNGLHYNFTIYNRDTNKIILVRNNVPNTELNKYSFEESNFTSIANALAKDNPNFKPDTNMSKFTMKDVNIDPAAKKFMEDKGIIAYQSTSTDGRDGVFFKNKQNQSLTTTFFGEKTKTMNITLDDVKNQWGETQQFLNVTIVKKDGTLWSAQVQLGYSLGRLTNIVFHSAK